MALNDDTVIIAQVLAGNSAAFAVLVDRYKDMVFAVVRRVVISEADAEEIAQDVFLKAYQALKNFKQESKFSTWLYRIATNAAISSTRKRKITTTLLDESVILNYSEDEVKENLYAISSESQSQMVKGALSQLHPQDALLLGMFYDDNLSIEEISDVTGLSQANVKVRLHRVRKRLYVELSARMNLKMAVR